MATTGLFSIALVEEVNIIFVLIASLVTVASLITKIYRPNKTIPPKLLNILSAVLLVLFFVDYLIITSSLVGAATRFITILALFKLFDLKNRTDYMLLSMLVFFQLLSATVSTVSPLFFLVMSLFIIASIWSMVLFNIEQDWNDHQISGEIKKEIPKGMFTATFFSGTVIVTFISIAITVSLFFVIPRMGIGLMHRDSINTIKVSGFADELDLGNIGSIKLDDTIVMRIEVNPQTNIRIKQRPLYIRGKTFRTFENDKWIKGSGDKAYTNKQNDQFKITKRDREAIEHKIMLEPLSTATLFGFSYVQTIEGNFRSLWLSPSKTLQLSNVPYSKRQYTAWSNPNGMKVTNENIDLYLSIPDDYDEIKNLALTITKGEQTRLGKVNKLENYLKTNYNYTLDPEIGEGATPLHDFLFFTKEGYCEQFSTALTIMLRSIGIPARLSTGFLEGRWNDYGNYYIVRQRDAHSWVEVFIADLNDDNSGTWITKDPTPPILFTETREASLFSLYLDSLKMQWTRYVVNFTSDDQVTIGTNIESQARSLKDNIKSLLTTKPSSGNTLVLALIVLFILALFLSYYIRQSKKLALTKTPAFYLTMLSILEKKGIRRNKSETPLEFAKRCNINEVKKITNNYIDTRYRNRETDNSFIEIQKVLLKGLKRHLKNNS